jgi:hypothetical protein
MKWKKKKPKLGTGKEEVGLSWPGAVVAYLNALLNLLCVLIRHQFF